MSTLCLFGFEEYHTLENLPDDGDVRYLYRVCRQNQIAPRTGHMHAAKYKSWADEPHTIPSTFDYTLDDLIKHIDTDKRKLYSNPWITTTLSLPWVIWRAANWATYEKDGGTCSSSDRSPGLNL